MRLIASDYDGTLNQNGISDRVRDALAQWRSLGNRFGIVSGRGIYNLLAVVQRDALTCDFLIANNGAVVSDGEGNVLSYHTGKPDMSGEIARFLLENGGEFAGINDLKGDVFLCSDAKKAERYAENSQFTPISAYQTPIAFTQIATVCEDEGVAERLTSQLNHNFAKDVTAFQNGICIDIVPYGINKASGIKELLSLWGAAHGDVCTVGDNHNDIAMLEAFRSYAVANAIDKVKDIAGAVVADLAELIERELNV